MLELSTKYRDSFNNKNRIIIWPETSFEGSIPSEKELLSIISKKILRNKNTTLILGLLRTEEKKVEPTKIDPKYIGKKMSRNEPCFCGSGKKYKRCCGAL